MVFQPVCLARDRDRSIHKKEINEKGMRMKSLGGYLFFFGLGSIILDFVGMQFMLLMWIDNWGSTVGWSIRIGMLVIGGALWLLGRNQESPPVV